MISARNPDGTRRQIPGWFVVLAILLTMLVTVVVVLKRHPERWPATAAEVPNWVTQSTSPVMAAAGPQGQFQVVAATNAIPPIRSGSARTHEDRGACALCHQVVDTVGNTVPAIHAYSALPHPYKGGLCINCHRTIPAPSGGNLLPMGATQQAPVRAQPREAAWAGMEVSPITQVTASQYSIPAGIKGVVVAEAEGAAGAAGVQAGDVVVAANDAAVSDMLSFATVTQNGAAPAKTVHLLRHGKFLEVSLGKPAPTNAAPQPVAQAQAAPAGAWQAQASPPIYPNQNQNQNQQAQMPAQAPGYYQGQVGASAAPRAGCTNRF